MLKEHFRHL